VIPDIRLETESWRAAEAERRRIKAERGPRAFYRSPPIEYDDPYERIWRAYVSTPWGGDKTCAVCERRRVYPPNYKALHDICPCQNKSMTPNKRAMLFIDQLETVKQETGLKDPVLFAIKQRSGYGGVGVDPSSERRTLVTFNLGNLPLGDLSPTYVYLLEFPDWHGERFVKVGIGLEPRLRSHYAQGGQLLQKVAVPRRLALAIERAILTRHKRYRPATPLPQSGDTECLVWQSASQINLLKYAGRGGREPGSPRT
jgi:hypothetical protein